MTTKKAKQTITWTRTKDTLVALGISRNHLRKLQQEGLLKQGIHWRNIGSPTSQLPTYEWNVDAIQDILTQPAETR